MTDLFLRVRAQLAAWTMAALLVMAMGQDAHAATLISNLDGSDVTQSNILPSPTQTTKAMGFTVGMGSNFTLTSAILRLQSSGGPLGVPLLSLVADNGGLPGTQIATFASPVLGTDQIANYTFAPTSSVTLLQGMTYWLVLTSAPGSPLIDWKASRPGVTPSGLFTHSGAMFATVGAGLAPSGILNSYALEGEAIAAIPLPAGGLLLISAVGGFLALRRRKRIG
jgi:hypothetical protein